jgi:hypothetical protein
VKSWISLAEKSQIFPAYEASPCPLWSRKNTYKISFRAFVTMLGVRKADITEK